jgi:Reverse transcriptase (RNA-dependent DNA polymerase)
LILPPGFENDSNKDLMCKLKNFIYDFKQSPQVWYNKHINSLLLHNFMKNSADFSIFVKHSDGTKTIILMCIDDIIISDIIYSD